MTATARLIMVIARTSFAFGPLWIRRPVTPLSGPCDHLDEIAFVQQRARVELQLGFDEPLDGFDLDVRDRRGLAVEAR